MGKKFDAAALADVGVGLKENENPHEVKEFCSALNRIIQSLLDITKSEDDFVRTHGDQKDPLWSVAGQLVGKPKARSASQACMELRHLCNRLRRVRIGKHSEDDVSAIVAIAEFVCAGDLFVEAA